MNLNKEPASQLGERARNREREGHKQSLLKKSLGKVALAGMIVGALFSGKGEHKEIQDKFDDTKTRIANIIEGSGITPEKEAEWQQRISKSTTFIEEITFEPGFNVRSTPKTGSSAEEKAGNLITQDKSGNEEGYTLRTEGFKVPVIFESNDNDPNGRWIGFAITEMTPAFIQTLPEAMQDDILNGKRNILWVNEKYAVKDVKYSYETDQDSQEDILETNEDYQEY